MESTGPSPLKQSCGLARRERKDVLVSETLTAEGGWLTAGLQNGMTFFNPFFFFFLLLEMSSSLACWLELESAVAELLEDCPG